VPSVSTDRNTLRGRAATNGYRRRTHGYPGLVGRLQSAQRTLVEAGVLRGRTITSYPSVRTDIRNTGGTWVDEQPHDDGRIVSSRRPADLDAFCAGIVQRFEQGTTGIPHPGDKAA
jgi:protease I